MNSASTNTANQCFSNFNVLVNHWRSCYTLDPQYRRCFWVAGNPRSGWGLGVLSSEVMPVLLVHGHALNSEALFW